jgi:hypothetical protein
MTTPFPSAAEHAVVMVEACGNLRAAREAADINWQFATTPSEFLYWLSVATYLEGGACLEN